MDIVSTCAVIVVAALIYYNFKAFSFWSSRGINGPRPWPFLGTEVYYIFRNKPEVDMEWRKKYGRTYGVYEGYWPTLRTVDNELIKQIMIKDWSSFTDRDVRFVHGEVKRWQFFSKGNHWINQRALISPLFTSSRMKNMFLAMRSCTSRLISELKNRSTSELKEKKAIFTKDDLMAETLDIIAQSLFSIKLDTYQDKNSEFSKRAYAFSDFSVLNFFIWLFIPQPISKFLKYDLVSYSKFEYFDKLSMSILNERRKNPDLKRNDFIQALMEAKIADKYQKIYTGNDDAEAHYNDSIKHEQLEQINEQQSSQAKMFRTFDDKEICGQAVFFFLAGYETTSSTLSFCFYELGHQQQAQQEVYEEIIHVLGDSKRDINYDDISQMKKLDAFISEAMRMYAPVTDINRMVTNKNGVVLYVDNRPLRLPNKTNISVNPYVLHRDREYWDNVDTFDMTRFYPENRDKIKTCTYAPFGLGPRNCAGMRFALMNVRLTVAMVLLNYQVFSGPKSESYPPEYNKHSFFIQLSETDTQFKPRV